MAKYKVPTCDCGTRLIHYTEEVYKIETKITNDGRLSKKNINRKYDGNNGIYERLICPICNNEYWMDVDDKDRIIRAEEFSS